MSRAPSDGSTSICNKPPYVFPPPPAAEPTAPPAFLSPYFPLHPRSFHPFSPSPPVSTSTLIPDFCLHPRFVHAFSCRRSAPTAPTLSTPFPRSFRETVQLSSRFEPLFFAVSFREKAGQGEKGAGKEGRKEGRIEKVGLDWVLLKGGNALFKCSPREHTEDKTAPRRRIRRVNRHTTLPSSSFSLLFINCCYREGGGEGARQFSRCNTLRPRRGTGSTKLFNLFLHQLHTRKEMIPSIYDESIRNTYSRISRINDFIPNFT